MGRLEGKRILVSAAGQGIGRASALRMAAEGGMVFATDVNAEALKQLEKDDTTGNISTFLMDVTSPKQITEGVDRAKPDVLFNCAGLVHSNTVLDCTEEEWECAFDVNCKSMFRMMKAALPGMVERKSGSIINMSSVISSVTSASNRFVYGASKAAVIGMTKSVAKDFVSFQIRCNCICPAMVDSPSMHQRLRDTGDYDAALESFLARQPLGRMASPEEIASLVVYLASDESAFVTGQAMIIDAGVSSFY